MSIITQIMDGRTVGVFVVAYSATYIVMKLFTKKSTGGHKYPPCMRTLPIIGSIPFIPDFHAMHIGFLRMTEQLGNVFSFYIGSR